MRALELADELDDDASASRRWCSSTGSAAWWATPSAAPTPRAPTISRSPPAMTAAAGGERRRSRATRRLRQHRRAARHAGARAREWQERDELFSAEVLWDLAWVELWAGRWELAAEHAARAHDISVQYGVEKKQDHIPIAWIAAYRGELELAREESERALELCEEQIGFHPPLLGGAGARRALERGRGDGGERLGKADQQAAALGWGEPSARPWTADYVEALLELGRIDEAERVVDGWEADAARLGRERVLAQVTRCRGLVAAARGDVDEAAALLEQAVAQHEEVGDPFGRARALLALGIVRRRARQKRAGPRGDRGGARRLRAARRGHLGREGACRARTDRRSHARGRADGGRAPRRRSRRRGRTNREVAAALFLGERTVAEPPDAHLREARRALAHRAGPPAALRPAGGKVRTF